MKAAGLTLLAVTAVALHAAEQVPTTSRLRLQGRVITRGTSAPVPHARIVAAKVGGAVEDYRTTMSDSRGWFVFSELSAGSYRVHADAAGYLRSEYGRPPVATAGIPIVLTESGGLTEATILMTPTGAIAGRVTDRGRPAANVWVRALKPTYRDGQRVLNAEEYAVTDDRGEYRLFDLAPGVYYVSAIPSRKPRLEGDAVVTPAIPSNANGNRSEIRTPATLDNITAAAFETDVSPAVYHPNSTDPANASAIEIAPGATVLGIDLTVARTGTFHVRGRISTQGLAGTPRMRVSIFPSESGTPLLIPPIEVAGADFDLPGVPPGRYHLSAQALPAPGERAGPLVITRVPIEVWDRDLEGVVVLVQPGVALSGRVLVDGAPPAADRLPSVQLLGLNGMPGSSARRVNTDGTFVIDNVAIGEYRWRLIPFGGGIRNPPYVKTARFGADDVSGRVLSVGTDAASRQLEFDISTRTASLGATVIDSRKRPMEGVLVVCVPDPALRKHSDAWRSAMTGPDGTAQFEGLPPGNYWLFATETIPADAWQDPSVLKRYESKVPPVKLDEGTRVTRVLTVIS